ncbi:MAG: porin, partial [Thermoanaerobaculia bacterium]|nr:porin [Thermoanaerobaculia bacterium]
LLISGTTLARAEDPPGVKFSFAGYGTVGVVHSSEGRADFLGGQLVESGAGHTRSWSPEVDSRIGAQVTATLGPKLSAVVQVLAEQRFDGSYTPHLEWANVKYQFTPDASVRLGRIALPVFMVSDFRKVGYANVWVRPPVEVYGLIPIFAADGLDASYRVATGEFTSTFQANYGRNDAKLPDGSAIEARDSWGLTVSAERGAATLRLGFQQTHLRLESFNPLFDAFRQFGPEGISIANRYDADGSVLRFFGAGAQYDPGDWFVMAEVARTQARSAFGDQTAWYVSGGYRFGKLTPYLTYAEVEVDGGTSDPGLTLSAYPPELRPVAAGLNANLNLILGARPTQNSVSFGARWDFWKSLALKAQFDHSRLGAGSPGRLSNPQPGFTPGGSYDLFSLTVDFVF